MDDLDPAVLARARAGDLEAQKVVARAAFPHLRRWALLQTADPSLADDVVQETLVRYVRKAHTWDGERPFAPWLRAILRNVATTLLTRRRPVVESVDLPSEEPTVKRRMQLSDSAQAALQALGQLTVRQREVLDLCGWQGHTPAEAAELLGLDAATVRVHLHRARMRLREILDADGADVLSVLREES